MKIVSLQKKFGHNSIGLLCVYKIVVSTGCVDACISSPDNRDSIIATSSSNFLDCQHFHASDWRFPYYKLPSFWKFLWTCCLMFDRAITLLHKVHPESLLQRRGVQRALLNLRKTSRNGFFPWFSFILKSNWQTFSLYLSEDYYPIFDTIKVIFLPKVVGLQQ